MSDQRCKNCKHWERNATHSVWCDGYGTCGRIKFEGDIREIHRDPESILDEEPAFVEDGSDYHAALRAGPEFGCILWEAKDDHA
jgi:hypothetical protein